MSKGERLMANVNIVIAPVEGDIVYLVELQHEFRRNNTQIVAPVTSDNKFLVINDDYAHASDIVEEMRRDTKVHMALEMKPPV